MELLVLIIGIFIGISLMEKRNTKKGYCIGSGISLEPVGSHKTNPFDAIDRKLYPPSGGSNVNKSNS